MMIDDLDRLFDLASPKTAEPDYFILMPNGRRAGRTTAWWRHRLLWALRTRLALLHCAEALQETLQEDPHWQPEPLDEITYGREQIGEPGFVQEYPDIDTQASYTVERRDRSGALTNRWVGVPGKLVADPLALDAYLESTTAETAVDPRESMQEDSKSAIQARAARDGHAHGKLRRAPDDTV